MMTVSKPLINLLRGHPHSDLLPALRFRKASELAFSNASSLCQGLNYGPDQGYEPLRRQLASWLTQFYQPQDPIGLERISISGGASQNLARILQVFSDPIFTNVWMVSPTYFLACRIFQDSGFHQLRSIPEDEEGIDIEFLREELRKSDEKSEHGGNLKPTVKMPRQYAKIYRHLIYCVPTFSNPSSTTMSHRRRQELVRVARDHNALIITDDVYDQLQWPVAQSSAHTILEHADVPRIVDIDRYLEGGSERNEADGFGNSVSNGSFSKIVGPGCRTGWIEGTEKFAFGLAQGGSTKSGGAPSQLTATIMAVFMESGNLQSHILQTLQPAYRKRHRSMLSAIEKHLIPLGVTLPQSGREVLGGYFTWLSLPGALHADQVAAQAKDEENLIVAPGSLFRVHGDSAEQNIEGKLRVCFAYEDEYLLSEGIERLGRVIHRMLPAQESRCL